MHRSFYFQHLETQLSNNSIMFGNMYMLFRMNRNNSSPFNQRLNRSNISSFGLYVFMFRSCIWYQLDCTYSRTFKHLVVDTYNDNKNVKFSMDEPNAYYTRNSVIKKSR